MSSNVNVTEIERKTFQKSQQDGVMEMVIGLCFVAMSGRLLSRALIFTLVFPLFLPRLLVVTLRKRFTYPRIGYVKFIPDSAKEVVPGILLLMFVLIALMALALLLFGDVGDFDLWVKWCPALFGVQLASFFVMLASRSGSGRHYVFAGWSVMAGFLSAIPDFEFRTAGVFVFFLTVGALLTFWGHVLFIRFLRNYPLPAEEGINAQR